MWSSEEKWIQKGPWFFVKLIYEVLFLSKKCKIWIFKRISSKKIYLTWECSTPSYTDYAAPNSPFPQILGGSLFWEYFSNSGSLSEREKKTKTNSDCNTRATTGRAFWKGLIRKRFLYPSSVSQAELPGSLTFLGRWQSYPKTLTWTPGDQMSNALSGIRTRAEWLEFCYITTSTNASRKLKILIKNMTEI